MANIMMNTGKLRVLAGSTGEVDLIVDTIKAMLVETNDDPDDPDIEFVGDYLGAGDADELTSTGYTGGFGGSGRKTLASKAFVADQTNNRAEFDFADIVWSALSQAAAEDIVGLALIKEITNDAASPIICALDTATGLPLTPNSSDVTLTVDAQGFLHWT